MVKYIRGNEMANGFGACARLLMETQHLSSNPQMALRPRVTCRALPEK